MPSQERGIDDIHDGSCAAYATQLAALQDFDPIYVRFGSSSSTKTSIARTGLSSQIQSSRHSGNTVLCPRSVPSTKRLIPLSRESYRENRTDRRFYTARVTTGGYRIAALASGYVRS